MRNSEDVYVGFSMNGVEKTTEATIRSESFPGMNGLKVNLDWAANGDLVGMEILNALYVEVNGIRVERNWADPT
jgi:hypothetical protein